MEPITEARVNQLIREQLSRHELRVENLMRAADQAVRRIEEQAAQTANRLEESNTRAQVIYDHVEAAARAYE